MTELIYNNSELAKNDFNEYIWLRVKNNNEYNFKEDFKKQSQACTFQNKETDITICLYE